MYIRITSKCNMRCAHCCFSCRPGAGEHMPMNIFDQALDVAEDYGESVALGGGEPTMHPQFFEMLQKVKQAYWYGQLQQQPFMVTNGKNYSRANKLIQHIKPDEDFDSFRLFKWDDPEFDIWNEKSGIRVELSTDYFHESIDPRISRFYHNANCHREEFAGTRDVTRSHIGVMEQGRAKRTGNYTSNKTEYDCVCDDWVIQPNGDVFECGCMKKKVGTIWDRDIFSQKRNPH